MSVKDEAHYGFFNIGGQDLKASIRQAERLVVFAEAAIRRAPA